MRGAGHNHLWTNPNPEDSLDFSDLRFLFVHNSLIYMKENLDQPNDADTRWPLKGTEMSDQLSYQKVNIKVIADTKHKPEGHRRHCKTFFNLWSHQQHSSLNSISHLILITFPNHAAFREARWCQNFPNRARCNSREKREKDSPTEFIHPESARTFFSSSFSRFSRQSFSACDWIKSIFLGSKWMKMD